MAIATAQTRWRFTVEDFDRMGQAGIFDEDDRVELIQGEVRCMSPIGPPHASVVNRLTSLFNALAGKKANVSVQAPVHLSRYTQPQPDVALLRPRADFYAKAHPKPADVLLLVEVADTTLLFDREEKVPLSAQAGIPEVWLVDLAGECLIKFTKPSGNAYGKQQTLRRGETLVVPGLTKAKLAVSDILG